MLRRQGEVVLVVPGRLLQAVEAALAARQARAGRAGGGAQRVPLHSVDHQGTELVETHLPKFYLVDKLGPDDVAGVRDMPADLAGGVPRVPVVGVQQ